MYVHSKILVPTLAPNLTSTNAVSAQIGINYTGTAEGLGGCVNDAKNVREFLMSRFYPHIAVPFARSTRQRAGILNQRILWS